MSQERSPVSSRASSRPAPCPCVSKMHHKFGDSMWISSNERSSVYNQRAV